MTLETTDRDTRRIWRSMLKTGMKVCVYDALSGEPIYGATVRVTVTGQIRLIRKDGKSDGSQNWDQDIVDRPGAGPRRLGPVPKGLAVWL